MYSHIERRRARPRSLRASRLLARLSLAAAAALLVLLAYQTGTVPSFRFGSQHADEAALDPSAVARIDTEVTVSQSRFTGFDKQQQPFTVTARNASQEEGDKNRVQLEEVEAHLKRKGGANVAIRSQTAQYDSQSRTIELQGNVTIVSEDGFMAKMEKAHVNIAEHRLRTDVPVEVVSSTGVIRSNGMEIMDDGARILFLNRVRATFGAEDRKGSVE
jgi:lipopolysaccharide export system protein LptC